MATIIVSLWIALVGTFNENLHGDCTPIDFSETVIELTTDVDVHVWEDCSLEA
jgi:hypothetical protein